MLIAAIVVARYFAKEQAAIEQLDAKLEGVTAHLTELQKKRGGVEPALCPGRKEALPTSPVELFAGLDANRCERARLVFDRCHVDSVGVK